MQLVESVAEEPQIWRADMEQDHQWVLLFMAGPGTSALGYSGKAACGFSTVQRRLAPPNLHVVEGSTVIAQGRLSRQKVQHDQNPGGLNQKL